ncbi:hypothetical protein SARC_03138 [Sphaeroforma arctica JP610]|uniref:Lon N-terminal domain-containing protein n=1 Tax=Sphaeroforma arctica JP610 TaxID=667725 RepID=A0A0L0G6L7_9EUKA|nr:hypothetical protein SARC_03138 [Sphaeroforma arctica JP610]KNC84647.1 hypothetical protein SARC_03138 [Sphaeroforma arctica JP610]|eukprot:XP_014158549.1 hypothetical protein SARC_03138 [Sphaeroforma arctica JP610]
MASMCANTDNTKNTVHANQKALSVRWPNGDQRFCSTMVIQTLIEIFFESEYRERVEQYQRDENGAVQTDTIAIFCDTIMLPGTSATMEVFEPRYRLMIRRCIGSGNRAFGTMNSMDDKYGGLVSMTSYKQRPDGTSIIEVTGTKTFKVLSFGSRDGYTIANVLWPSEDGTWPQETDNESGAETAADVDSVVAESGSDEDEADMLDISSIPSLRNLASRTEAGAETNAGQTAAQNQQSLQTAPSRILADMRSNVQSLWGHPLLNALVTGGGRQPSPTDDGHFLNWCMSLTLPSRMQYELVFGEMYRDNYHLRVGVVHLLWQRAVVHILSTFGPARSGATLL